MPDNAVPFELELLERTPNYQRWVADSVNPFLGKRILEWGAGTGNLSRWLPRRELLVLSEADPHLFSLLQKRLAETFPGDERVLTKLAKVPSDTLADYGHFKFDTVVSFNVLEHIEDDAGVMRAFIALLKASPTPGPKRFVSFVPAQEWAFGTLDEKFGHYRRYSRKAFEKLVCEVAPEARLTFRYFNLLGLPGWVWMGKVRKTQHFNPTAVGVFERLCPYIRPFDDLLQRGGRFPLGQSAIAVVEL